MLGYGIKDIYEMQEALIYAIQDITNRGDEVTVKQLENIQDLLGGLLTEGHIN